MVAAGLLRRARDREDERQVRITLTPQGVALRGKAAKIPVAIGCALGEAAGDAEKLHRDVVALRDALNAAVAETEKEKTTAR